MSTTIGAISIAVLALASVSAPVFSQSALVVTLEGVAQDRHHGVMITCEAIEGRFRNCSLAQDITLDDIAHWMGYSANTMLAVNRKQSIEIARLKRQLRKARLGNSPTTVSK